MPSLYIHIPFCISKCAYCDFVSFPKRERDWDAYLDALIDEIESWRPLFEKRGVETVFIGGGTPTVLNGEQLERLLAHIPKALEFTSEANPGTLTADKLSVLRTGGVNRLSIGAQSFDDRLLGSLGRIHGATQIAEAVVLARRAGFENLNLDLMYALPGQTMTQWLTTLDAAIALHVPHISAYSLIVEEGTPMAARVACGEAILPDDDAVNTMQRLAVKRLAEAGYGRYEISNYALPGYECAHNRVYWNRGDYIGVGCAAHSLLDGKRFSNPAGLEAYLRGERHIDEQTLTEEDVYEESVMLMTRTREGIPLRLLKPDAQRTLEKLIDCKLARIENNRLVLTTRGMELQDAIVLEFL